MYDGRTQQGQRSVLKTSGGKIGALYNQQRANEWQLLILFLSQCLWKCKYCFIFATLSSLYLQTMRMSCPSLVPARPVTPTPKDSAVPESTTTTRVAHGHDSLFLETKDKLRF